MSKFQGKIVKGFNGQVEMHIPAEVVDVVDSKVYRLNNAKKTEFIRGIIKFVDRTGTERTASAILYKALQDVAEFSKGDSVNLRAIPSPGMKEPLLVIGGATVDRPDNSAFFTEEELAAVGQKSDTVEA